MRTLAEEILTNNRSFVEELAVEYPTYFDTNNLTITQNNYFLVVSKYRLGTAQTHQFQSGEQYGTNWHWGSKLNESGDLLVSTDNTNSSVSNPSAENWQDFHIGGGVWIENNSRAVMPRVYIDALVGGLYNNYAAAAESLGWSAGIIIDSICPSGWQLPTNDPDDTKSWSNLLDTAYEFDTSRTGALRLRTEPFNFPTRGIYNFHNTLSLLGQSYYWTSAAKEVGRTYNLQLSSVDRITRGYNYKSSGLSVRCVKK